MKYKRAVFDIRTILIIVISLSTLSVVRQILSIQLMVLGCTIILLSLRLSDKATFVRLLVRLRKLIPIIISLSIMQLIFRRGGAVYYQISFIQITESGVFYSIAIGLRIINLIMIAGLLFNISSSEYLITFKTWRIPYEISFLVTAVIRFIPDYLALFQKYRETLLLRGVSVGKLSFRKKIKAMIVLIRTALIDSLNGVTYRAISLDMKGFRLYPVRTYIYDVKLSKRDLIIQVAVVLLTVILIIGV